MEERGKGPPGVRGLPGETGSGSPGESAVAADPPVPPLHASSQAALAAAQRADPLVGRTIAGRFRLVELVARGGMGKVYRAEQAPLGRVCAVKVLDAKYSGEQDPEFSKRFFKEASVSAKLTHPNTVTIFDYGKTDDDVYFMAMEYLEGKTLRRALYDAGGRFPEARAIPIAAQICRSIREAHTLGVVHRDLKPANVFLVTHGDETDFVKVLDFGLVKDVNGSEAEELTQTGLFMGSPKYMAPEQIQAEAVDGRADVYALGVVLFQMLTGTVPFDRPSNMQVLMAHVNEPVPAFRDVMIGLDPPPPDLEAIVRRCLQKSPADRFASMDELLVALKVFSATAGMSPGSVTSSLLPSRVSGAFETLPAPPDVGPVSVEMPRVPSTRPSSSSTLDVSMSSISGTLPTLGPGPTSDASASIPTALDSPPRDTARAGSGRGGTLALVFGALLTGGLVATVALRPFGHAGTPGHPDPGTPGQPDPGTPRPSPPAGASVPSASPAPPLPLPPAASAASATPDAPSAAAIRVSRDASVKLSRPPPGSPPTTSPPSSSEKPPEGFRDIPY